MFVILRALFYHARGLVFVAVICVTSDRCATNLAKLQTDRMGSLISDCENYYHHCSGLEFMIDDRSKLLMALKAEVVNTVMLT